MRKLPLILGASLVTLLGAGHYLTWQTQSTIVAQPLEQMVAHINKKAGKDLVTLSFERKEQAHYPSDPTVTYHNPTLMFNEPNNVAEVPMKSIALTGDLSMSTSLLDRSSTLNMTGALELEGGDAAQPYKERVSWDSFQGCRLQSADSHLALLTGKSAFTNMHSPTDLLKAIQHAECSAQKLKIEDMLHNETVFTAQSSNIIVDSSVPMAENPKLSFNVAIKQMMFYYPIEQYKRDLSEMATSLEAVNEDAARFITHLATKPMLPFIDPQKSGASDFVMQGETEGDFAKEKPFPFSLTLTKLHSANKLMDINLPFTIHATDESTIEFTHDGTMRFNPAYAALMDESVDIFLEAAQDPALQLTPHTQTLRDNLNIHALRNIMTLPLHDAGEIRTAFHLNVAPHAVNMKPLSIQTALFGIKAGASITQNQNPPKYDGTVHLTNYAELIKRTSSLANDISALSYSLGSSPMEQVVSDAAQTALVTFLGNLDTESNKLDTSALITIASDAQGMPTISQKPAMAVLIEAATQLAPHFPILTQMGVPSMGVAPQ